MKTADTFSLTHERVDDIPLLLGFMQQLNFPDLLERHLGSHHLHRGLSNGWLATVWLAFLLSQSNHRKVSVQDWASNHAHTLEGLIGQPLGPVEFGDDRLSIILRRLRDADWSALEADLWQATCEVYEILSWTPKFEPVHLCWKLVLILTDEEVQDNGQEGEDRKDSGGGEWARRGIQGTRRISGLQR